jgi:hypothetical protein
MALYCMSVDGIALAAATAKSIAELATSAQNRARIVDWWIEFDGVDPTNAPVKVEVGRFTAAVTTASPFTEFQLQDADGTPDTVAQHSTTVEGAGTFSAGEIHRINPTTGVIRPYPLGREWYIPKSGFWRIRCTAADVVNATLGVIWEES